MEPFLPDAKESVTGGSICSNDSKGEHTSMTICTQGPVPKKRVFVLVTCVLVRIHIYMSGYSLLRPPAHPKARVWFPQLPGHSLVPGALRSYLGAQVPPLPFPSQKINENLILGNLINWKQENNWKLRKSENLSNMFLVVCCCLLLFVVCCLLLFVVTSQGTNKK